MTETEEHKMLKEIAMAYLFNQRCFLVATEVLVKPGGQRLDRLDSHFIIDVCGVGEKYIPYTPERNPEDPYKYNILRGVEAKVSRNDFKNGFVCSGCNFHYIIIPEGLVQPSEVPKEVGIIEIDLGNFHSSFEPAPTFRFSFEGMKLRRKPTFRKVAQYQIDNAISSIGKRATRELINQVAKNLTGVKL